MTSVKQALDRVEKVLESSFDPSTAYPLRARLGRAVRSSVKVVSGLEQTSGDLQSLVSRLDAAASHVMQPSEPFDSHWREQWADILFDLRSLRNILERRLDS